MKLFIVAGKARHGKDTTCSIIKDVYEEKGLKVLNLSYGSYIKMYAQKISNWDGNEETKPRELLQKLGTDIIRHKIDYDFFVNRICEDILVYSYFFDVITISDARFVNEIEIPKSKFDNVITIHVERTGYTGNLTSGELKHETEVALDSFTDYDFILKNNGTIDDLKNNVLEIIKEVEHES